jgi:flagellar biogenesis protein FliO
VIEVRQQKPVSRTGSFQFAIEYKTRKRICVCRQNRQPDATDLNKRAKARMPHLYHSPKRTTFLASLIVALLGSLATSSRAIDLGTDRSQRDVATNYSKEESYEARTSVPRQPASTAGRNTVADSNESNASSDNGPTLPLASKRLPAPVGDSTPKTSGWSTLFSAMGSLTIVLGLFLAVMWFVRRTGPKSMLTLPGEVFEVLGRSPLAARQQAQLVRCGNKLLLLCVTAGGTETLTEISDAAEVERLTGLCQQTRPNSATASFRNLFSQFGSDTSSATPRSPSANRMSLARLSSRPTEAADV